MPDITINEVEAAVRAATPNGAGYVTRLGGNVWGVSTGVHTVTLNDGQCVAETPASMLVCRNGATVLVAEVNTADEITQLLATIPEVATFGELPELHAIRTTETPTERAILANFLIAAGWADAVGSDGEQITGPIDADDITADPEVWLAVRKMIRAFLAELDGQASAYPDTAWPRAESIVHGDPGQAGHDLWLTMRGHGVGFWDRGHGEAGELLTELARRHGSEDAHVYADMPAAEVDEMIADPSRPMPELRLAYPG